MEWQHSHSVDQPAPRTVCDIARPSVAGIADVSVVSAARAARATAQIRQEPWQTLSLSSSPGALDEGEWRPSKAVELQRLERRNRMMAALNAARKRMVAAAYVGGGLNVSRLFRHYDRDNDGGLSLLEWRAALRRDGKLNRGSLSDHQLAISFDALDIDRDGAIGLNDLRAFLAPAVPGLSSKAELSGDSADPSAVDEVTLERRLRRLKVSELVRKRPLVIANFSEAPALRFSRRASLACAPCPSKTAPPRCRC